MMQNAVIDGTETPPCTICRRQETETFPWGSYHLNLLPPLGVVKCRRCDVLFLSPRPAEPLRHALHSGTVPPLLQPYSHSPANYAAVTEGRTQIFKQRLDQLETLSRIPDPKSVRLLDVGASSGVLLGLARARGWKAQGVEPSADGALSALAAGVQMPRAVAEKLPFRDGVFDIVHSHHVFEHLADPLIAAREAYRVLRPGGVVFIEVPNQLANVMFRRDMILRRVSRRKRNIRSIHHLWFFSRKTLPELLRAAGFTGVEVLDHYYWRPQGLRAPLTLAMQLAGRIAYGGPLVQAYGYKPENE